MSRYSWQRYVIMFALFILFVFSFTACEEDDDDDKKPSDDDDDDDTSDDDDNDDNDDNNDDDSYVGTSLLPGPDEEGYDAELEAKADQYDRSHLIFNCAGNGVNADITVALDKDADRQLIEDFIQTTGLWDFEAWSGKTALEVVTAYHKVAGLYGGVGIAADAYRYGTLRDQNYPAEDINRAREFLLRGIEAIFVAVEITGEPGVIVRGFCRTDVPGYCATQETTPLFDGYGNPLPDEKDNGTWREDNSADNRFPNYKWEDSCSRDQFIGWAAAFAAVWEVIKDDTTFSQDIKDTLQQYASQIGQSLMVERTGGPLSLGQAYDLEIFDADGRTTFHGYMNENAWDRVYLAWLPIKDGFYAMMALGSVAALAYTSEDPVLEKYLYDNLIGERRLDEVVYSHMLGVNLWYVTNYSATNMGMMGALLAQRYINDETVREKIQYATKVHLYENGPVFNRQPEEYGYSLFDFIFSASVSGASAFNGMLQDPDFDAIDRGAQTLFEYADSPYWDFEVENCDEYELSSGVCELNNGDVVTVLGEIGRKGTLITKEPIPQEVRPPSNYRWRSCPYTPNGGGNGSGMLPAVDFRFAYWYGRWVK